MTGTTVRERGSGSGVEGASEAVARREAELAELMRTFNEAAEGLQATHESLRLEVRRLESELAETKGQLRRARELAALGEMAAGISHEIRNPLGSIKLYCGVLVEELDAQPELCELAVKAKGAVDRLDEVVGDVLAFSRELRVRGERASVADLVAEAVEGCAGHAASLGVELSAAGEGPAGWGSVWCDVGLVRQAMVNLVRNACDAAAEGADGSDGGRRGGRVLVGSGRGRALDQEGARVEVVRVVVEDDGPGVPEGVRERMFNPFFTTRAAGTGLGLPIASRIASAHGGWIGLSTGSGVASGDRPGSTVELVLPAGSGPVGCGGGVGEKGAGIAGAAGSASACGADG